MKQIYFVRHCKAIGQEPEARLTEEGIRQARELAEFLKNKNIEYIISSPFERAIETIKPLCKMVACDFHIDNRLQERILSKAPLDNWMEILEQSYENYELKLDGGESSTEAVERGMSVVREMIARPEKSICVVTHGALLSLLIRQFNKEFGFEDWKKLSNPDVYKLEIQGDQAFIERVWQPCSGPKDKSIR